MTDKFEDPDLVADELRTLLQGLGVVPRDLTERPAERERAERDLARILSDSDGSGSGPREPRRARVGRAAAVLAVACVLATVFVVIRPGTGSDPAAAARTPAMLSRQDNGGELLSATGADATAELGDLADRAERQPEPAGGPVQLIGRSSWLLSTDEGAPGHSVIVPTVSLQYFQPDGTVRAIERRSRPLGADGRLTDSFGQWSTTPSRSDETFDGPETGPEYADELSLRPSALARSMIDDEAACRDIRAYCLFTGFTFLHYNYVLRPSLNAALWRTLATEPGFRFLGTTVDRVGRTAVAFSAAGADPSRKVVLLADPETGAFLGSEEVLVRDSRELGLEAPAVVEFTALEESSRVEPSDLPDVSETTRY
jgi:hypothetical protein